MMDFDHSSIAASQVPVLIAAAKPSRDGSSRSLTTCQDIDGRDPASGVNSIAVVQGLLGALGYRFDKLKGEYVVTAEEFRHIAEKVSVAIAPQHGSVVKVDGQYPVWQYLPTEGYAGKDRVSFVVEWKGQRVLVTYRLWVVQGFNERQDGHYDCDFVQFGQAPVTWSLESLGALARISELISGSAMPAERILRVSANAARP